tara:strand:- start:326 stop:739 length:414 start_codon:yes stop_codon:yes gene_type:complete
MTNSTTAFDTIKDQYDLDTLREIMEHGCQSGVANYHIYYNQTVSFYDDNEEEIVDYIVDNFGTEFLVELFSSNDANLDCYKNDVVWTFVELVASQLVDEYESTTQEELSDLDDNVYSNLVELSNTEWGRDHLEIVTP